MMRNRFVGISLVLVVAFACGKSSPIVPSPTTCDDPAATNFGGVLPCTYSPATPPSDSSNVPPEMRGPKSLVDIATGRPTNLTVELLELNVPPGGQYILWPGGIPRPDGCIKYTCFEFKAEICMAKTINPAVTFIATIEFTDPQGNNVIGGGGLGGIMGNNGTCFVADATKRDPQDSGSYFPAQARFLRIETLNGRSGADEPMFTEGRYVYDLDYSPKQ